ncbi:MAG: hypothetical protein ACFFKA_10320 [Candidatus Thorarchaeota archaeon]
MVKIILEIAENGVIKTIRDDNSNGGGETLEEKTVYDFTDSVKFKKQIRFFYELAEDLGIDTGNKFQRNNLKMSVEWGSHYEPSIKEVSGLISRKKLEVSALEQLLEDELKREFSDINSNDICDEDH